MKNFYFLSLLLFMALTSCFEKTSNTATNASPIADELSLNSLLDLGSDAQKSALLSEDLGEFSQVYLEASAQIDPTHSGGVSDPHENGPSDGAGSIPKERFDRLKNSLKFLFNGCHPKELDRFKERLIKYIAELEEKIAKKGATDRLKDKLENAQKLLKEIEDKIADCAKGNKACSDVVKEQVAKRIESLEKEIAELEDKRDSETDPKKIERLDRRIANETKRLEYLKNLCD
ncbi:MAG: hypothetical protein QE271_00875 [Bacteriovoracaceae bacterium]|nr:hypothetical protein [Bacteriovoracaceae bacterium]